MSKLPFKLQLTPARIAVSIFIGVFLPMLTYTQLRKKMLQSGNNHQRKGTSMYDDDGVRRLRDGTEVQKADIWDMEKWKKNVKVKELK